MSETAFETFVKICGITRAEEARTAERAGANALGFVFADGPRRVSSEVAGQIAAHVHPSVWKVGVFVDAPVEVIQANVRAAGLDGIQLHGSETVEFVRALKRTFPSMIIFKAIKVNGREAVRTAQEFIEEVDAVILDPKDVEHPERPVQPLPFDWLRALPLDKVIIAGGLNPDNVAGVIKGLNPWGVDASGGLEIHPGAKDPAKVRAFVKAVREAEKSSTRASSGRSPGV